MTAVTDDIATEADSIRNALAIQAREIREDAGLTEEGKQIRIKQVQEVARERMDNLKAKWGEVQGSAKANSMRTVFGSSYSSGADAISIRDAEDRAGRLETTEEARTLLERAQRSGDKVLERAIALEAIRRGESRDFFSHHWKRLVREYVEANPSIASHVDNLVDGGSDQGFRNAMTFMLQRANEL